MKYRLTKEGLAITSIETLDVNARTTVNILMGSNIPHLRQIVKEFFIKKIKQMKSDSQMIIWKTSIGEFSISKESRYKPKWKLWKSPYKYTDTVLEFVPKKGDIQHKVIKTTKTVNKEYEDFKECNNCYNKSLIDYEIIIQEEPIKVCKKCYDFNKILNKLDKNEELTQVEIRSLSQ